MDIVRVVFNLSTHALALVKNIQLRGKITLGVPNDFSITKLHKAISYCLTEHPELKIEITAASSPVLSALLENQQLDMAITKEIAIRNIANYVIGISKQKIMITKTQSRSHLRNKLPAFIEKYQ
ncbi:LysR substrate-binding domain-containing protein [Xenorhabdus sp. SGI240]|uniref:LysR substrate-binding domain-containing protein n=1 Tax=Xenorhabdus sp. SGI240 TaxID=3158262 RepID=UPI0032B8241E